VVICNKKSELKGTGNIFHIILVLVASIAFPCLAAAEVEIAGGITMIGQGASGVAVDEADTGMNYSVDVELAGEVGDGKVFVYFVTAEGGDIIDGANADYEAGAEEDPENPNNKSGYASTGIAEAWYELPLFDGLNLTLGKIDPAGIYDANEVANDQTTQFLAGVFVNNAAIPLPAYTIGFSAGMELSDSLAVNVGLFEDGGITGSMETTFMIGEVAMGMELLGGETNVRLTYWQSDANTGYALNADQSMDSLKFFLRYGIGSLAAIPDDATVEEAEAADKEVESAMSVGMSYSLSEDLTLGAAYSLETPRSADWDDRNWMEAYVSLKLNEDVAISFDYQTVDARDFDATADTVSLYGARLQIGF